MFLDFMLIVREEKEWKNIDKYINRLIASENAMIAGEILQYLEPEERILSFRLELLQNNDNTTKSNMIITRLRELHKKKSLEFSAYVCDHTLNNESLKVLFEVKTRLADIQIKYNRHLSNPIIVESLQKLQDGITLLNRSRKLCMNLSQVSESIGPLQNMIKQMPPQALEVFENMAKQMPNIDVNNIINDDTIQNQFKTVIPLFVELPIKLLLNEIITLWNVGITFSDIF